MIFYNVAFGALLLCGMFFWYGCGKEMRRWSVRWWQYKIFACTAFVNAGYALHAMSR